MTTTPFTIKTVVKTLLVALIFLINGCDKSPVEEVIKSHLQALEAAIENNKAGDTLELVHDNFKSDKGQDKTWVKRTVMFYNMRYKNTTITTSNLKITQKDDYTATASFNALLTGGRGLLPEQGALYQVETEWRNDNGDWQVVYAKWKKALTK